MFRSDHCVERLLGITPKKFSLMIEYLFDSTSPSVTRLATAFIILVPDFRALLRVGRTLLRRVVRVFLGIDNYSVSCNVYTG